MPENPNKKTSSSRAADFVILPSPVKSDEDKLEYRVLRLKNGLTACLISDMHGDSASASTDDIESESEDESDDDSGAAGDEGEESEEEYEEVSDDGGAVSDGEREVDGVAKKSMGKEKMAAAALCIGVGSFSDPPDIPGLAHFLEHMVFMGSEKYPKENNFDAFVSQKGGDSNASTDSETTTFYFSCLERYLRRTTDRFAQFFTAPLLKRGSMTRERQAIESEFQAALPNDKYRVDQMLANLYNPAVPINPFNWGNLKTLEEDVDDEYLYEKLHAFNKLHYSAHRMTFAIQARMPLDELQDIVLDYLSNIPTNNLPVVDLKQYSHNIYETAYFNRIYYVKPMTNVRRLDLVWVLPSLLNMYESKPHRYYSWLLGGEGTGSLLAYLRKKVWALGILVGNSETSSEHNNMYSYFPITITLTEDGLIHLSQVIEMVFSYINLLKREGPNETMFREIQHMENISFRYKEAQESAENVENLAESMQYYKSEHYLTGPDLYFNYSAEAMHVVLNHLRPDNVNIMVLSSDKPEGIEYNRIEKWFKVQFTDIAVPNEWLERWTNVKPLEEFSLPTPNPFIPADFELVTVTEGFEVPKLVQKSEGYELWYKPDTHFRLPTAAFNFYLISPTCLDTPEKSCLLELFLGLVSQQMIEEVYPAAMAELNFSIAISDHGIHVNVNGFNDKLPILLQVITRYLTTSTSKFDEDVFLAVKSKLKSNYCNRVLKPSSLSKDLRLSLLIDQFWTGLDKHNAVDNITLEMLKSYAETLFSKLYIQMLMIGNVSESTAKEIATDFNNSFKADSVAIQDIPKTTVRQLPKGEVCCRVDSLNSEDSNSYITNYYQAGTTNLKDCMIIELILLIIDEPFFDVLRTKEQLGYTVYTMFRDTFDVLGLSLTVNTYANKATTSHVDARIDAFMKSSSKLIQRLNDKRLAQIKKDLIKTKQCQDLHLDEEMRRYWEEIVTRHYMFDRKEKEISMIETIKPADLKKFWEDVIVIGGKVNRKLTVQVVGHVQVENKEEDEEMDTATEKLTAKEIAFSNVSAEEKRSEEYFIRNISAFKANLTVLSTDAIAKPLGQ